MLTDMMKHPKVNPYVWFDGLRRPDFDYIFRIIATCVEGWYERIFEKKNEMQSKVFICPYVDKMLRELPVKDPSKRAYKKLGIKNLKILKKSQIICELTNSRRKISRNSNER